MKRYLLFAGSEFYPSGGWWDFVGSYDSEIEAFRAAADEGADWYHVVDSVIGAIVGEPS